jgi:hypothetical protein
MASAASATRDFRIPDRLTVQSVTECLEQYQLKWQQQLALQKKELFFWFHAETRGRDEASTCRMSHPLPLQSPIILNYVPLFLFSASNFAVDKSKARLAELEEETARLAAQSATLSAELETAEGKLVRVYLAAYDWPVT